MYIKKALVQAQSAAVEKDTQREAVKMRCWELSRGLLLLLSALFNSANQYHMLQHPLMVCSATWYIKSPLFYTRPAVCTSLLSLYSPLTHLLIYIFCFAAAGCPRHTIFNPCRAASDAPCALSAARLMNKKGQSALSVPAHMPGERGLKRLLATNSKTHT